MSKDLEERLTQLMASAAQNADDIVIVDKCLIEIQSVASIMKNALTAIERDNTGLPASVIARTALEEVVPYAKVMKKLILQRKKQC